MTYEELPPSPDFAQFIERYWAFEIEASDPPVIEHVIVPDGTISLTFAEGVGPDPILVIIGPFSIARKMPVFRGARFRGVRFRAGAASAFLGVNTAQLVDQRRPLADLDADLARDIFQSGAGLATLAEFAAMFESITHHRLTAIRDEAVCALAQALIDSDGSTALSQIIDGFGLSPRHLRRRFIAQTGLTPKMFSRLRRVRRACVDLIYDATGQVAAVSADNGYADQPHFNREIKAVFDMSPHLVQAYLRMIRHTNLLERG